MQAFNELIKNYGKIRSYLHHFSIYGIKTREDFTHKSGRTYDNERRRIQSYLGHYMEEQTSSCGKRVSIHFDSMGISSNPFFETFKSKSFTSNDIFLHFVLLDILHERAPLCLNEICDRIFTHYLSQFDCEKKLDSRTIRLKLEEYTSLGILESDRIGKTFYYRKVPAVLDTLSPHTQKQLKNALSFFQNVAPLGIIGHMMLESTDKPNALFTFPDLHFTHVIDDEILLRLLEAITHHQAVLIYHSNPGSSLVLPIKIVDNVDQGRRYVMVYHYGSNRYKLYRLDKMLKVELTTEVDKTFPLKTSIVNTLLENSWGVSLNEVRSGAQLETWSLILSFKGTTDKKILDTLVAHTPHALLQRTDKDLYTYTLSVIDAHEMTPWLRRFMGHIVAIECTNLPTMEGFVQDIKTLLECYTLEDDTHYGRAIRPHPPKATYTSPTPRMPQKLRDTSTDSPTLQASMYEVFHKYWSKYYTLTSRILEQSFHTPMSLAEIRNLVSNQGFIESPMNLVPLLTSEAPSSYSLLKEQAPMTFCSILGHTPTSYTTYLERTWLRSLLLDPKTQLFLDEDACFELTKALRGISPLYSSDVFTSIHQHTAPSYSHNLLSHFKFITLALVENRLLTIDGTLYIPYKLEYSLKKDGFSLLAIDYTTGILQDLVRLPLNTIETLVVEKAHHLGPDLSAFVQSTKRILCFKLWDKRRGFDRVFMYLSHFERTTTFDEATKTCTAQLTYYPFEEDELITSLLSFGPIVKVISPTRIQKYIIEKLHTQDQLFATFFS
ncbi:MAG: helix-turn-helix transcriptional regulator [Cellulosilyticaceae bacterium]